MNNIKFVEQLPEEIEKIMEKGLEAYELQHDVVVGYKPFALILYDDKIEVIGVLDAFCSYSSIHIKDMWIHESHRNKGYGQKLLFELENRFKNKGLHNINTVSCAFQAPDFYKKCGFEVEFVRENKINPKLTMTFLIKYFDDKV